jgi:hypothetical protein
MTKTVTVTLRIAPEEHAGWTAAAAADGRSLASWIRRQCAHGQPAPAPDSKPKKPKGGRRAR